MAILLHLVKLKLTLFSPECKSVTTNGSDNRRNYIALLSVNVYAYMVNSVNNVSLPIPNTCNYYYSMSGKWYLTLAILVSTISETSNRSQKCKSTDCQSKNKCNLSHKETMMTWVSTQNDGQGFHIRSFYVYLQRSVNLKSLYIRYVLCKHAGCLPGSLYTTTWQVGP